MYLSVLLFIYLFSVENAGGEMDCASPGSPNGQSSSASPHREVRGTFNTFMCNEVIMKLQLCLVSLVVG